MNTKKATKRALLTSVMALVMCIVMLVGTTFAWFTDTASTNVNKIVAGNLKVDIVDKDGNTLVGENKELKFANLNEVTKGEAILWEPGCRYLTEGFRIANKGNLALKWKAEINKGGAVDGKVENSAIAKDGKSLLDVIDFYVVTSTAENAEAVAIENFVGNLKKDETSDVYYIKGVMQTTAGNDYQDLTLDGITITVYATQDTVENDSFDNKYDEGAPLPEIRTVTDAVTIDAAVKDLETKGSKNVIVSVAKDLDKTTGIKIADGNTFTMNLNGKTVSVLNTVGSAGTETLGAQFLKGSSVTLKDGTYKFSADSGTAKVLIQNYTDLTLEDVTLDASSNSNAGYALSSNCGKVVIKGKTNITVACGGTALDVMHWENASYKDEGTSVVFDESMTGTVDGKIEVYCYRNGKVVKPVDDGGAVLTIMGGTFVNSGLTLDQFKAFVPTGYTVTTNSDGSFTVSK